MVVKDFFSSSLQLWIQQELLLIIYSEKKSLLIKHGSFVQLYEPGSADTAPLEAVRAGNSQSLQFLQQASARGEILKQPRFVLKLVSLQNKWDV